MSGRRDLSALLGRLDGRGYKAYKQAAGEWRFKGLSLFVDHVQGDPYADPSRVRVRIPMDRAAIPPELFDTPVRSLALRDFLGRAVRAAIARHVRGRRGTGGSGRVEIDAGAQEILERTAVRVSGAFVEARLQVGLPADGRRVRGRDAADVLCDELPAVAAASLCFDALDGDQVRRHVGVTENYFAIRDALDARGLVAFVADGAVLPRESGASQRPMSGREAVAFEACAPLRVALPLPNGVDGAPGAAATVEGLGIPRGVTLVVGGGYHGKSTLLRALERGVYPHVPGDGREYVATDPSAVKIRAEDGRSVAGVDISPFISNLPAGRDTRRFCSDDASGSTSQAAAIVEALEAGARTLLLDEDTCATNFMVRDARMQALVAKADEPITPFVDRVRELLESRGVSTILVMGGSGDYFEAADTVVMMRDYVPHDVTTPARRVAAEHPTGRRSEAAATPAGAAVRRPLAHSLDPSRGRRPERVAAEAVDAIIFGRERIDLRAVEQLADPSQTRAIARLLVRARSEWMDGMDMVALLDTVDAFLDDDGLEHISAHADPGHNPGRFARPRRYEVAAAINRLRTLRVEAE